MGQGMPAEGADPVVAQKLLIIQAVIERPLSREVPDLSHKNLDIAGYIIIHRARLSNNQAVFCKKIVV